MRTSLPGSNCGWSLDESAGVAGIGDPLSQYGSEYKAGRAHVVFDNDIFCHPFEQHVPEEASHVQFVLS